MNNKKPLAFALRGFGICLIAGAGVLLAGCQTYNEALGSGTSVTATDSARLTRSGFLSDYARLKPVAALDGIECWRDTRLNPKQFDKVLVRASSSRWCRPSLPKRASRRRSIRTISRR